MSKFKLRLFMVISVLALLLTACNSENNGFNENIKNMNEAMTIDQEKEYILYFYSSTCSHCAKFKPTLNKYAEQKDALPVYAYDLDVEENIPYIQYFVDLGIEVSVTPTIAYIYDGSLYALNAGGMAQDDLATKGSYKKILEQIKKGETVKGSNMLEYGQEKATDEDTSSKE